MVGRVRTPFHGYVPTVPVHRSALVGANPTAAEAVSVHPATGHLVDGERTSRDWALVVDADPGARAQLCHAFAALGYRPVACADAVAARAELSSRPSWPAVVVVDLDTPTARSLAGVCRHRPDVPLVVCARRGSNVLRSSGVDADGVLAKPLDLVRAVAELRTAVRRPAAQRLAIRRARRALRD